MPIGTGIIYNVGDLILSQVSGSGTSFLETKIAAATSSIVYFDNTARINSASLNSITVGTASYVSGSTSIITNLTASNISASLTGSFGYVGIGTNSPIYKLDVQPTSSTARIGQSLVGAFPANPSVFSFFGHSSLDNVNTAANYAVLQSSTGDSFLNASSGRTIYFRLGNSDKMILNSSGQFGIGTTSPITGYLDVRSNQTKSVAGPTNIAFFGSSDAANPLGLGVNHESSSGIKMVGLVGTEYGLSGNNIKINETLHVQYSSNVGIGTTSPSFKLHTAGAGFIGRQNSYGSYDAADADLIISNYNVDNTSLLLFNSAGAYHSSLINYYNNILSLGLNNSNSTNSILTSTAINITSTGVGIGTTAPAYLLDVSGSSRYGYQSSDTHQFTGSVSLTGGLFATNITASNISASGTSSFGYVGIGTPSPNDLLQLQASSSTAYDATSDNGQYGSGAGITITNMDLTAQSFAQVNLQVSGQSGRALGRIVAIRTASATSDLAFVTENANTKAEKMRILSDGNVGIGTNTPGAKLEISSSTAASLLNVKGAGGNGLLFVSGSGFVGIGTTAPVEKLDVRGGAIANGNGTIKTVLSYTTEGLVGTLSNHALLLYTNNTEKVRIISDGNVGIGTTNPSRKLTINNGSSTGAGVVYPIRLSGGTMSSVGDSTGLLFVQRDANDDYGAYIRLYTTQATPNYLNPRLEFGVQTTDTNVLGSVATRMVITGDGNVGIGTTSPGALLEVSSSTAASLLNVKGAGGNAILFVSGSGNVGIGTTNPSAKLTVVQSAGADSVLLDLQSNNDPGIRFGRSSYGSLIRHISATTDYIAFNCNGTSQPSVAATAQVVFDENGYVGIGTSSPADKLSVISGSVRIATSSLAGALYLGNDGSNIYLERDNSYDLSLVQNGDSNRALYLASAGSVYVNIDSNNNDTDKAFIVQNNALKAGTELFRVSETGNVGIGTTSPEQKLHVRGYNVYLYNDLDNNNTYFYARNSGPGNVGIKLKNSDGEWTIIANDRLRFIDDDAGGVERLSILSDGNVGIGTTSPVARLAVVPSGSAFDSSNTMVAYFGKNTTNGYGSTFIRVARLDSTTTTGSNAEYTDIEQNSGGSGPFRYGTYGDTNIINGGAATNGVYGSINFVTSGSTRMTIAGGTSAGNVGIGTTSPVAKLQVAGNISGSSFTSSISNAVGFLGTSSWAQNVVSASFATTAQTANALNTGNSYTISGLTNNSTLSQQGTLSMGSGYQILATTGTAPIPGISFVGDTNTGIYAPSADTLGFSISGSERVRIDSNGNVGIGTTNPDPLSLSRERNLAIVTTGTNAALTIVGGAAGRIDFGVGATRTAGIYSDSSNYTEIFTSTALPLVFSTNSAEKMRITSTGNVGIGTTSPGALLEISSSTAASLLNIKGAGGNGLLFVSGSGYVGIGTASPGYTLEVNGTQRVVGNFYLFNTVVNPATNFANQRGVGFEASTGKLEVAASGSTALAIGRFGSTGQILDFRYASTQIGYFSLDTNDLTLGTARHLILSPTGNVGINQTSPAYKLDVNGTSRFANDILSSGNITIAKASAYLYLNGTNSDAELRFLANSSDRWAMGMNVGDATENLNIYNYTTATTNFTILKTNGNVGIGSTAPNDKLDVVGRVYAYRYIAVSSNAASPAYATDTSTGMYNAGTNIIGFSISSAEKVRIDSSGNVGIGTTAPAAKLEISGSSNSVLLNIKSPISGAILFVSGSGAVGINTSTVGAYTLQVNGSFAATTKSFIIDHPTKAGKKLIYGSLESPYHGIRLTGRDTLKEGKCKVELPDYIYKLILHDSVNIQLTGIKCNKTLYVDEINIPENYFTIAYDNAIFESYKDYDFFWDFTGIRTDVPELITEL